MGDVAYCPICGKKWKYAGSAPSQHRCSKRSLSAIDGANTRSWEPCPLADPTNRSEREKMKDGFKIIDGEYDDERHSIDL